MDIKLRDLVNTTAFNQHINICDKQGNLVDAGSMSDLIVNGTLFRYGGAKVLYVGTEYYSNTLYIRIVRD